MDNKQKIKDSLHKLIERSNNEYLLGIVYQVLNRDAGMEGTTIPLTEEQQKELDQAYQESLDESNLIDFEDLKEKNAKWLGK